MRARLWSILLLTPFLLAGVCDDDSPTGTGTPALEPTLDNLWPNADGASWTYALHERIWGDLETNPFLYDTPEEVPPPPTLDQVAALLENHTHGSVQSEDDGFLGLLFDGEIDTGSGATVQNLVPILGWQAKAVAPRAAAGDALLRRILAVRPDLRARAARLGLKPADPGARDEIEPLFLHGGAWVKTDEHIGIFGTMDQPLAWKFLESDLTIGHEFTHQIVPDLSDDIWLHARIVAVGRVDTPAGRFRKVVTCLYYLDYGVITLYDGSPIEDGYGRMLDYGTVSYAPEVGPVRSYERKFVAVGETGFGEGIGELEISLTATNQAR